MKWYQRFNPFWRIDQAIMAHLQEGIDVDFAWLGSMSDAELCAEYERVLAIREGELKTDWRSLDYARRLSAEMAKRFWKERLVA